MNTIAILTTLLVTTFCSDFALADAKFGRYSMKIGQRFEVRSDGQTPPSCGSKALRYIASNSRLDIVSSSSSITVNGTAWPRGSMRVPKGTVVVRRDLIKNLVVQIAFASVENNTAKGSLMIFLDGVQGYVCADAIQLTGVYHTH